MLDGRGTYAKLGATSAQATIDLGRKVGRPKVICRFLPELLTRADVCREPDEVGCDWDVLGAIRVIKAL